MAQVASFMFDALFGQPPIVFDVLYGPSAPLGALPYFHV